MAMKSPLEIIFSMKQKSVVVQLKNGFTIRGLLEDVDYFLNLKLSNITATDKNISSFKRANMVFLRGNLISSIVLEKNNFNKLINNSKDGSSKQHKTENNVKDSNNFKNDFIGKKRKDDKKKY
jgi:small nuclear ribonucleoprotein (snRNP)-like protein